MPGHEEGALFRLFRKGNARARERLIAANLRFVVKVALEYRSCPMPVADSISEGSLIGLIDAVETFDPGARREVHFLCRLVDPSYITKALNEKGYMIRLPANHTSDCGRPCRRKNTAAWKRRISAGDPRN